LWIPATSFTPPTPSSGVWVVDEDDPTTLLEFEKRFSSEEACIEYAAALRWPFGWSRVR
jgi:hypothetical protein